MRKGRKIVCAVYAVLIILSLTYGCGKKETVEVLPEVEEVEKTEERTVPERKEILYMAVPIESMSMRANPGFDAEIITQIYPDTLLKKAGETAEVNGTEFYYVSTLDDCYKGYCAANYCIEVFCERDDSLLTVVDTENEIYTYEDMEADLWKMAELYPEYMSLDAVGKSVEGRALYRVILGNQSAERKVLIQAGIHGREYISSQLVMKMLEYYLAYYENGYYEDEFYTDLFDKVCFHILPMTNPDGVSISQKGEAAVSSEETRSMMRTAYKRDKETMIHAVDTNGDLYWYDTYANPAYDRYAEGYDEIISYEEYLSQWKANTKGVDINRNFDAGWEDIQQKDEPGYESFKGYFANSEQETKALTALLKSTLYECIISYHARGQLIYYDVVGNSQKVSGRSESLAKKASELIRYQMVNCKDSASVSLGGFGDWAMLNQNIASITIEVGKRPCPVGNEEFLSIWNRNRELWAKIAKEYE